MGSAIKAIVLSAICCVRAIAAEGVIKDSQGMDCHVYTPDAMDPAVRYQLVVGVHGAGGNGKGAAGMKDWARRGDVIVIGPSFDTKGEHPYQNGDGVHAEKLIALFETLKKSHKLRDQMFLHGFSGGSQFVHRFAMLNPKRVCGVSAHSGGTWATDNFGEINTAAKKIPFAISCGEKDTQHAFQGAPYNRLEWYRRFREEIDRKGFRHIGSTWPDVGHSMSSGAWDLTRQCFQLATGLRGQSATEPVAISDAWKNLDRISGRTSAANATRGTQPADKTRHAEIDGIAQAAFKRADAGKVPDEMLIGFMKKYPPVLWKDKSGSAKLLEQCKAAAMRWHQAAKLKGMLTIAVKADFARFSEGLEIHAGE